MLEMMPTAHPIFVHFTVALLFVAAALFILGTIFAKQPWAQTALRVAHVNLWLGAIFTIGTVTAGLYAYNTVNHDTPSHLAMTNHREWALPTAALFIGLAIWSIIIYRRSLRVGMVFLAMLMLASGALGVTAWKGGELVYTHGLGVMSILEVSGDGGHDSHDHPNDVPDGGHGEVPNDVPEAPPAPQEDTNQSPKPHDNSDGHAH